MGLNVKGRQILGRCVSVRVGWNSSRRYTSSVQHMKEKACGLVSRPNWGWTLANTDTTAKNFFFAPDVMNSYMKLMCCRQP